MVNAKNFDERLAYSEYISSGIPFNNNTKEERTDILILNNPVAVSDEENTVREYGTIVIFELKSPMRDDYSRAEDEDFKETPDKRGYYKYHDKKHAYIEILSYNKSIIK